MKKESSIVNIGHAVRPMRMISRPRLKPPSQGHITTNIYPDTTKPQSQTLFKPTPQQTQIVSNPSGNVTFDVSHDQSDDHNDREVTPGTGSKSVMKPLGLRVNFAAKVHDSGSVSESEVEQSRSGNSSDLPGL
jgi:hypothetical protein